MTATPAWPLNSLPRLFIDEELCLQQTIMIDGPSFHYLCRVMRRNIGDSIKCFDNISGEYLASITEIHKRNCTINLIKKLKEKENVPDLWLCAAPIKRERWYMMAEKACELGVAALAPIQTQRSIIDKIKEDKLRHCMIEAAEQCERTALPEIKAMQKLPSFLDSLPKERILFFCDERGGDNFKHILQHNCSPAAILIGPEGGFTDEENASLRKHTNAYPISLGPRILRAETAAIAAVSAWMSHNGDW